MEKSTKRGYKIIHTKYKGDFEIPEKWDVIKLGQVTKLEYGKGLVEENRQDKGFTVYGSGGLIGYHSEFLKEGPGIIIARKGSLGNVYYVDESFWAIDTVYYITKDETANNLKFLFYLTKFLKLENYAIVTAQPGISRDEVYTILVKLPPVSEQKKIASILSNIDDLIQHTDKIIDKITILKKGLMHRFLTEGIKHTKFKKIKWYFGKEIEVPSEWNVSEISKVSLKIMKGIFDMSPENYIDKGIPFLRVSDIENNILVKSNTVYIPDEISKKFPNSEMHPGDIVMAKVGSIYSNDKIAIIPSSMAKCNISQNMIGIKLDKMKIMPEYFLLILQRIYFIISSFSNATTLGALRLNVVREQKIPIPLLEEQKQITSIISHIDCKIQYFKNQKSNLENLKKGLMQKLLTGQIRVKV